MATRNGQKRKTGAKRDASVAERAQAAASQAGRSGLALAVRALTALCLAWSLFGAGFLLCTSSWATEAVGNTFSSWKSTVLPAEDMAQVAEGVRAFSMGDISQEGLVACVSEHVASEYPLLAEALGNDTLSSVLGSAGPWGAGDATYDEGTAVGSASTSATGSTSATDESSTSASSTSSTSASATPGEATVRSGSIASELAQAGLSHARESQVTERLSLPSDALSHLDDCIPVFVGGRASVIFAFLLALAGLIYLGRTEGRRAPGWCMMVGGAIPVVLLAMAAVWCVVDFDGIFAAVHSLFFAEGTWTFSADSLLIQLFPEPFWAAMACLWAATSVVLSLVCIAAGRLVRGH